MLYSRMNEQTYTAPCCIPNMNQCWSGCAIRNRYAMAAGH